MQKTRACDILQPSIKSCEFLGLGPFEKTLKPNVEWLKKYRRYRLVILFVMNVWLARGLTIVAFKYIFARHLTGTASTDMVRAMVSTGCMRYINGKLSSIEDALQLFDSFPHTEATGARLTSCVRRLNKTLWIYVTFRIVLDLITVSYEGAVESYIETELLVKPSSIPRLAYPAICSFMVVDITMNRIFFSAGLTQSLFFYIFINFLIGIKFWKFDEDLQKCRERIPHDEAHLYELRLRHAGISQLTIRLDELFCPLVLVFHAGFVVVCCTESISLIQRISGPKAGTTSKLALFGFALNMVYLVVNLMMLTAATSIVCESPNRSMGSVCQLVVDEQQNSIVLIQQARLLMSQMRVGNVQVTAWKFYSLNRSTMMTTLAAALSYVSVVIQQARDTPKK